MREFDYVIIGGGCAGLSLAYELEINEKLKDKNSLVVDMRNYWRYSRSTYYSVVMALPLLLAYEILIILTQSNYWVIRNAADVWIRTFLMAFDLKAQHLTFVMIGILFLKEGIGRMVHLLKRQFCQPPIP